MQMEAFITLIKNNVKGLRLAYNWFTLTVIAGFLLLFIHQSKLSSWSEIKNVVMRFFGHNNRWVSIFLLLMVLSPWIIAGFNKVSSALYPHGGEGTNPYRAKRIFVCLVGITLGTLFLATFLLFNHATHLELNILTLILWLEIFMSFKTIFYIVRVSK